MSMSAVHGLLTGSFQEDRLRNGWATLTPASGER